MADLSALDALAASNGARQDIYVASREVESAPAIAAPPWPEMEAPAFHGLLGDIVRAFEPHSEADPVALALDALTTFGALAGASPHAIADGADHPARLFICLVGPTSRARKGTSRAQISRLFGIVDANFACDRTLGGLASGEGLIHAIANDKEDKDEKSASLVADGRLLVYEPEFVRVLKACAREGSTLSAILRDAWDRGSMQVMTRSNPLRVQGAHVSIIGHCTQEELTRSLADVDIANGFANRFLFACVRRSKKLPEGSEVPSETLLALSRRVRAAIDAARRVSVIRRTSAASDLWREIYNDIDDNVTGLIGALGARAEAHMLRLAVAYALLDSSDMIDVAHLQAAQAVWRYSEASARYIFGKAIGDPIADKLLAAIREAGPEGLDGSAQHGLFGRNVTAAKLERARDSLERTGDVTKETSSTGGRPREIWRAVQ